MTNNISENPREQHPDIPQFAREKRGATLKDSCVLIMGQSPSSNTYNTSGDGLPFYQGNADFGEENPVPRSWCTEPKKIAEKGDILISVRAPIGAINIADEKCCIGRGVAAIRPNQEVMSTAFLQHQLFASRSKLEAMGTGSTFKAIGKKTLSDFPVVTYPMNIQEAIAQQLSLIKKQIKTANSRLDQLDSLVKSRFVEMFDSEKFELVKLGGYCERVTKGATPTTLGYHYQDNGINFIKVESLAENGSIVADKVAHISDECNEAMRRSQLRVGDIVFSIAGAIGRTAIIPDSILPANTNQALAIIRLRSPLAFDRIFLRYALISSDVTRSISSSKRGIAQVNLSLTDIKNLRVPLPPLALQQEFAAFVSQVDKLRFETQQQIEKLETLKKSLMQEYFG